VIKPKKLARKGVFRDVKKLKFIPRKPVTNGAI